MVTQWYHPDLPGSSRIDTYFPQQKFKLEATLRLISEGRGPGRSDQGLGGRERSRLAALARRGHAVRARSRATGRLRFIRLLPEAAVYPAHRRRRLPGRRPAPGQGRYPRPGSGRRGAGARRMRGSARLPVGRGEGG